MSKRKVLRKVLPHHPDDRVALSQLRRQLGSAAEVFPSGRLRGRVRQAEKVELLQTVPLFDRLRRRELAHLARLADEIHCDEGQVLSEEGQLGDESSSSWTAVCESNGGRKIAALRPGEFFGQMSLLDNRHRSATVLTTAPSALVVLH